MGHGEVPGHSRLRREQQRGTDPVRCAVERRRTVHVRLPHGYQWRNVQYRNQHHRRADRGYGGQHKLHCGSGSDRTVRSAPAETAGGVAILRLFHEAGNGCNWFWWTMGTSAQWQDLFKYAFNYLTATKGLNNVLWLAPLCGSPTAAYNPGLSTSTSVGRMTTYRGRHRAAD